MQLRSDKPGYPGQPDILASLFHSETDRNATAISMDEQEDKDQRRRVSMRFFRIIHLSAQYLHKYSLHLFIRSPRIKNVTSCSSKSARVSPRGNRLPIPPGSACRCRWPCWLTRNPIHFGLRRLDGRKTFAPGLYFWRWEAFEQLLRRASRRFAHRCVRVIVALRSSAEFKLAHLA
jgi:hypothetical protein